MDLSSHLVKQTVPVPSDVLHKRPKHDTLYRSVPARYNVGSSRALLGSCLSRLCSGPLVRHDPSGHLYVHDSAGAELGDN